MGEERIRPTRSGLFMIELLIAVGVFTLCAAVCVGLFVRSEVMSRESADLTRMTTEEELSSILSSVKSTDAAVGEMIESAKRGGGDDNITVVLIDLGELPAPLPAMRCSRRSNPSSRP